MKRLVACLIVTAALLVPASQAGAVSRAAKKACGPDGSAKACKEYIYKTCVAAAKKQGASNSEAKAACRA